MHCGARAFIGAGVSTTSSHGANIRFKFVDCLFNWFRGKTLALKKLTLKMTTAKNDPPNVLRQRLTPLARLYYSFAHELSVVSGYETKERYEGLLKMYQVAEARRDGLIKSVFFLDAIALLLMFGKAFTLPSANISIGDLPAAREVATFLAASTFFFLMTSFLNVQGYAALIDVVNQRKAKGTILDPDFLTAADKFYEFPVKLYNPTLNSFAPDVLEASKVFRWICVAVQISLYLVMLSLLLLHLSVAALSITQTFTSGEHAGPLKYVWAIAIVLPNLGGLVVLASTFISFEFKLTMKMPDAQTQAIAKSEG